MSVKDDGSDLLGKARKNARRVADRLRRYQDGLDRGRAGDLQGAEALREAAASAERIADLMENSSGARPAPGEPSSND